LTRLAAAVGSVWRNRRRRAVLVQALLLVAVAVLVAGLTAATAANLHKRGIVGGFGFLTREAGFGLGEGLPLPLPTWPMVALWLAVVAGLAGALAGTAWLRGQRPGIGTLVLAGVLAVPIGAALGIMPPFVAFDPQHTLGLALVTGFANTLKVAVAAIVLASAIGLAVGMARLAPNPLLRAWGALYVEVFRNVPLLIQVFFWYFGVLRALPNIRQSLALPAGAFLNNRGLFLPAPHATAATLPVALAVAAGVALAWGLPIRRVALRIAVPVLAGLVAAAWAGVPLGLSQPALRGFNFVDAWVLSPEYIALLLGLSIYAGAFIAEIVRSGIAGVPRGQIEAARALGLGPAQMLRLVVLPQALRIMRPPLITQFVAQVKDSSLGVAIAYPELISVGSTVINQTGQVIEMLTVLIAVYMTLNLALAWAMSRRGAAGAEP
jgi:general L-amino acid transport system permease protein